MNNPKKPVEIWAHRGASFDASENTLTSVRLGWEQGADGVEIDVRLSRDGHIVVMHDDDTRRTAGVTGKIADLTFDELRRLDVGVWKDARFAGERIPTLGEVVAIMPADRRLAVEVKCGPEIVPALQEALREQQARQQICFIAFSLPTLTQIKAAVPDVPTYWLAAFARDEETAAFRPIVKDLIAQATAARMDGLDLSFQGPLDAASVRQIQAAGLKCYVWTVNDPADARRLADAGVNGITTDRPGWLRQALTS